MINGVVVKKLGKFEDARGWLFEIFRSDENIITPAMCYVSLTNPGAVRGPHEHKNQIDHFVFLGPGDFELHLWDRREDSPTKGQYETIMAGENDPCSVIIPSGIVHGYKCVSQTGGYCINLPDRLYKGVNKSEEVDEIRWEQDANSPYRIL